MTTTMAVDDYTEVIRDDSGHYARLDYCLSATRYDDGGCRCNSHPWYTTTAITLAEAFALGFRAANVRRATRRTPAPPAIRAGILTPRPAVCQRRRGGLKR